MSIGEVEIIVSKLRNENPRHFSQLFPHIQRRSRSPYGSLVFQNVPCVQKESKERGNLYRYDGRFASPDDLDRSIYF